MEKLTTAVCQNKDQSLGVVEGGGNIDIRYEITNNGTEDLYIGKISTSCGCTTARHTTSAIKPNQSGEVVLKFSTQGRKGNQEKSARVEGNFAHPLVLTFKLTIK